MSHSNPNSPSTNPSPTPSTNNQSTFHPKKQSSLKESYLRRQTDHFKNNDNDDEIIGEYPFVEIPLLFYFGNDYNSNSLFLESRKEMFCEMLWGNNYGHCRRHRLGAGARLSGDVYALSSEEDMIAAFVKDGLF